MELSMNLFDRDPRLLLTPKEQTIYFTENDSVLSPTEPNESKIFPNKLMEILSSPFFADCISWREDGKAFFFKDREEFTKKLTSIDTKKKPKKKNSFTRKLNRWGFRMQWKKGPDYGMYSHELFQRDKPWLCNRMVCEKSRNYSRKQSSPQVMPLTRVKRERAAPKDYERILDVVDRIENQNLKKRKKNIQLKQEYNLCDISSIMTTIDDLVSIERKLLVTEIMIVQKMKVLGLREVPFQMNKADFDMFLNTFKV